MTIVFNLKKLALAMIPLTLAVLLTVVGASADPCYGLNPIEKALNPTGTAGC